MDPIGLVLSIGTIIVLLDNAADSFSDANGTLAMIRTQMRILDTGVERVKEWSNQHGSSQHSRIADGLKDALKTVDWTMQRLRHDLEELTSPNAKTEKYMGKAAASFLGKSRYAWNEGQLKKHLTDVRECVSLVHFTLTVCQLPDSGQGDESRAEELRVGARTLSRAQQSRRQKHRTAIVTQQAHMSFNHSVDFQRFIADVLIEEGGRERENIDDEGYASDSAAESEHPSGALDVAPLQIKKKPSSSMGPRHGSSDSASQALAESQHWNANHSVNESQSQRSLPRNDTFSTPIPAFPQDQVSAVGDDDNDDESRNLSSVERKSSLPFTVSSMHSDAPTTPAVSAIDGLLTLNEDEDNATSSVGSFPNFPPRQSPKSSQKRLSRKPVRGVSTMSAEVATSPTETSAAGEADTIRRSSAKRSTSNVIPSETKVRHAPTDDLNGSEDEPPAYGSYDSTPAPLSPMELTNRTDVSANIIDESGCPYIIKATQDNMIAVVQILLERGADIEVRDQRTGRTAVMEAARLGREDIVDLLAQKGARLDGVDASGNGALHLAVEGGAQNVVKRLLASGRVTVNARGPNNRTPLHTAAIVQDPKMAMLLLRNKADPSLKDDIQQTPLHVSATRGHAQMCQLLLEEGASLESYDHESKTPLQLAAESDQSEVVNVLLRRTSTLRANDLSFLSGFYEAVKVGNVRMAQAFISEGIKVKKIKESWKPVAYAAQSGNIEMLNLMIDSKCNLKDRSPDGWTALHFAANHGHRGMVERLLEKKLSWKAQSKKKQETALHLAIAAGHEGVSEFLIQHKSADVGVKDGDDQAPLHHAIRTGSTKLCKLLLQCGAKLNECNKYGWRPIHIAAAYGHTALTGLLLSGGVSVEEKLESPGIKPTKHTHAAVRRGYVCEARWPFPGSRPLHLALEFCHSDTAAMLLAHGAKVDEKDFYGWRPLHYAAFTANPGMTDTLLKRGAYPHSSTNDSKSPLGVGVRAVALKATEADRERTRELLTVAGLYKKKSRLTSFMSGWNLGSNSANIRNVMWTAAETAEQLLAKGQVPDVEEGEEVEDEDEDGEEGEGETVSDYGSSGADPPGYRGSGQQQSQDEKGRVFDSSPPPPPPRTPRSMAEMSGSSAMPPELDGGTMSEMRGSGKGGW